jgi:DNA-directed RNA polymerase subunit K/omega
MAMVDPENDKPTVIALREIADGKLNEAGEKSAHETACDISGSQSTGL